ncbi:MAG TPA: sugar transferase [Mycobacteriales bacterium]|nr:sugar transferase [Mycobacteriales bacterium]
MPLRTSGGTSTSHATAAGKRVIDVIVGTLLSVAALPVVLLLAIALGVLLRSNPFFAQTRPGRNGKPFTILKLRTLPPSTPHYASKLELDFGGMGLPRLCELLRRTHLDELPQLFLVPFGSMTLVGPRPRLPDAVEAVDAYFDTLRSAVRPGCTGLWQISTATSAVATGAPRFDLFYVRHASVRLDLWIMVRTVGMVLGIGRPVEIDDVPAWVRGRGLVAASAFITPVGVACAPVEADLAPVYLSPAVGRSPRAHPAPAPVAHQPVPAVAHFAAEAVPAEI